MAVGHGIRYGEFLQSRRAGCLNDSDICYVMAHHGVKLYTHGVTLGSVNVMRAENAVGDSVLASFIRRGKPREICGKLFAVKEVYSLVNYFYHVVR